MAAVLCLCESLPAPAQVHNVEILEPFPVTNNTGEKPQSKVWFHDDTWWAVMPTDIVDPPGTWVFRLEPDDSWTNIFRVSNRTTVKADVKKVGEIVHILLHDDAPRLVSIEFVQGAKTYRFWADRLTPALLSLPTSESATIDIDSTGRMWLATETDNSIFGTVVVYYSDPPYAVFTGPITLANNVYADDIASVIALPNNTLGVFWSNQNPAVMRFGFRIHVDAGDPTVWLADEVPASQSAIDNEGVGMANDHLNLTVAVDGTLYAAIKTEYENEELVSIGLLVRRPVGAGPTGVWDDLYEVDKEGTRPIVLLNEVAGQLLVIYTRGTDVTSDTILFKESAVSDIEFGPRRTLAACGLNNATSMKDNWTDDVVVLAADANDAQGRRIRRDTALVASYAMNEGSGTQLQDASGNRNTAALSGGPGWQAGIHGLGLVLDGSDDSGRATDDASLDLPGAFSLVAWINPEVVKQQQILGKSDGVDGYSPVPRRGRIDLRQVQRERRVADRLFGLLCLASEPLDASGGDL